MRARAFFKHGTDMKAGTSQNTAAAAATPGGAPAPSGTTATQGTPATSEANASQDPLDAALEKAFGEEGGSGGAAPAGQRQTGQEPAGASSGTTANAGATSTAGSNAGQETGGEGAKGGAEGSQQGTANGTGEAGKADAELPEIPSDKKFTVDNPPPGFDGLPKGAVRRILKQKETIDDLKEQLANANQITLTPTPVSPLGHVMKPEALTKEINMAQFVRSTLGKLKPDDFVAGPDGIPKATVTVGNQQFVFSQAEVESKLGLAEAMLDPTTLTERQQFIASREQTKPWEAAEKVMPGVLQPGTPENQAYQNLVKMCPEIVSRIADHEFIVALAVRGLTQYREETAGKAKWVRMELDENGQVKPPQQQAATQPGGAPATGGGGHGAAPPAAPNGARPPVQGGEKRRLTEAEVLAAKRDATPEERLDALLDVSFG
jgi:hypothetical protein